MPMCLWYAECIQQGSYATEVDMQIELEDWRTLSKAASQEQDPDKLIQLIERLNHALSYRELADGNNNNVDNVDGPGGLMPPQRYSRA